MSRRRRQHQTYIESTCYAGFFLTCAFLGPMIARNRGHIVFVGSPAVNISFAAAGYIASRSAVRGLAQSLRYELSQCDVNVTYAEPSWCTTSEYFDTYQAHCRSFRCWHQSTLPASCNRIRPKRDA